jgi:alkaline phosphatase
MKRLLHLLVCISMIFMLSAPVFTQNKPVNIIVLIGDGMGLSELSASFYYGNEPSHFTRFSTIGLINTSSVTHKITDSGAGGTAFSTGKRTYNGAIGVDKDSIQVKNMVEHVSDKGYNTGIISTSSITHATPASYYAHVVNRHMEEVIAAQLVTSEIDFFAGGGYSFFTQRKDKSDLLKKLGANGFMIDTVNFASSKTLKADQKYGFLLAPKAMPSMVNNRGDFLPHATQLALDYFALKKQPFFLMAEASQIDWAGHDNDTEYLIQEVLDFNDAIGRALDFAEKDGNTLVVVTADHETGGFTLSAGKDENGNSDYDKIAPTFATGGHSAALVPVFAFGPGAQLFTGIYNNTDIYHKLVELID